MSDGYEAGRCVIGEKAHSAAHGYLCGNHFEKLGTMLRDIEDEAALLSAVPSMSQRNGTRGGSLASHRAPARLDVIVANDRRRGTGIPVVGEPDPLGFDDTASILEVLQSWARVVREERALTAPDTVTISSERRLLTTQLEWIAKQEWVDEAFQDTKTLLGQLRGSNGTRADRPYSHCPVVVNGDYCTGQVWIHDETQPVWRRYPDRCAKTWEKAPGAAVCDTCASLWTTEADKARLKRMIDDTATELTRPRTEDGEQMRTAEELASDLGMKVSAVRMRLSRAGAKAVHGGYYDPTMLRDTQPEVATA